MEVVIAGKIGQLPIEAVDRTLQRQHAVLCLLILPLIELRRIESGHAKGTGNHCRRVENVRNLEIGGIRAGDQAQARIGIEEGRYIGEAPFLTREVMDGIEKWRRVFDALVGLEIAAGEEILHAAKAIG